jgi:catechol 2,3-dioxygenase-like lactoylglutathione lyase family enzyme
MTTLALGHVNLRAPRELLDALKDFYCDVVGLHQGTRPPFPGFGYWLYAGDRAIVHLYEAEPDEVRRTDLQTTLDHFAFDCLHRADVERTLERLGVAYRTAAVPSSRQVQISIRDPAGNHVELNFAGSDD